MDKEVKERMDFRKKIIFGEVISGIIWILLGLSSKYDIFIIPLTIFIVLETFFTLKRKKIFNDIKDEIFNDIFESLKQTNIIAFDLLRLALAIFLMVSGILNLSRTLEVSLINIQMIIGVLLGCITILHIFIFMYYEKNSSGVEECKCVSEEE
ncbi:hypothetical protein ACEI87_09895 [Clostridioides difficile]